MVSLTAKRTNCIPADSLTGMICAKLGSCEAWIERNHGGGRRFSPAAMSARVASPRAEPLGMQGSSQVDEAGEALIASLPGQWQPTLVRSTQHHEADEGGVEMLRPITLQILICDDHAVFRRGTRDILLEYLLRFILRKRQQAQRCCCSRRRRAGMLL